jgi:hypothetical protein
MFANAEIGGALIISVGLSAIWAGYRRIRAEPFVARSFMRVNTTSLAVLSCVSVSVKYKEYKYITNPFTRWRASTCGHFSFSNGTGGSRWIVAFCSGVLLGPLFLPSVQSGSIHELSNEPLRDST